MYIRFLSYSLYSVNLITLQKTSPLEITTTEALNTSIADWINRERFTQFPKVTRGNLNQLMKTGKYLVLAVVEENKLEEVPAQMLE